MQSQEENLLSGLSILIPFKTDNGRRQQLFDWVVARYQSLLPESEICIGEDDSPIFSRSKARHNAFEKSTGKYLLFADADTVVYSREQIQVAINYLEIVNTWVLPYGDYYNLNKEWSDRVLQLKPDTFLGTPVPSMYDHKIESWAGLVMLTREMYNRAQPYSEDRFIGWGYEDNLAKEVLNRKIGQYMRAGKYDCLHLWHDYGEYEGFDSPTIQHNRSIYQEYLKNEN